MSPSSTPVLVFLGENSNLTQDECLMLFLIYLSVDSKQT